MAIVGKKFPDLTVNAMNEMGDTIQINVLEEAVNNKKKVLLFLKRLKDYKLTRIKYCINTHHSSF